MWEAGVVGGSVVGNVGGSVRIGLEAVLKAVLRGGARGKEGVCGTCRGGGCPNSTLHRPYCNNRISRYCEKGILQYSNIVRPNAL